MLQKHFTDCFWAYDTKDPTLGIRTLNKKIEQGFDEIDEIISFIKKRINIEMNYAYDLIELGQSKSRIEELMNDEGSSVYQAFLNLKKELIDYGKSRQSISSALKEYALDPLLKYQDTNKKYSHKQTNEIVELSNHLRKQKEELDISKSEYIQSCEISEKYNNLRNTIGTPYYSLDNMDFPALDVMLPIGPRNMTIEELNSLLLRMQHEIPATTVTSWIGNYQAMAGEDIVRFIMKRFLDMSKDDAIMTAQDLLKMGFIGTRSIGKQPFSFKGSYVWKKTIMEGEAPHKKAKREVERADFIYKNGVQAVENTRCSLECEMYNYLTQMEDIEFNRINIIRNSISALVKLESKSVMVNQVLFEHNKLYLETIQPERDLNQIINQCRTGTTHIPVTIYESFYYSPGHFQTFGVFLDQLAMTNGTNVPIVVKKCLSAIKKTVKSICDSQEIIQNIENNEEFQVEKLVPLDMEKKMWLGPRPFIGEVYELRNQLNTQKITLKILKNFKVPVIISVLKLFLQELPISLIAGDMYESFKMLYSGSSDNNNLKNRITSIERLLYTLSPPYYETLACIIKYLNELIEGLTYEDEFLSNLSYSLSHLILRPWTESIITINDKHPSRLVKDLIYYYREIFPERFTLARTKMNTKSPQRPIEITVENENEEKIVITDETSSETREVLATIDKVTSSYRASVILDDNDEPPRTPTTPTLEKINEESDFLTVNTEGSNYLTVNTNMSNHLKVNTEEKVKTEEVSNENDYSNNEETLKNNEETSKDLSEVEDKIVKGMESEIIEKNNEENNDESNEEKKVPEITIDETIITN